MKLFLGLCKVNNKSYFLQGEQILNFYIAKEYYDKAMRLYNNDSTS